MSRSPARQRVSQKPCGVSTVAPPVKLGQESACERKDRWSPIKCLGRTTIWSQIRMCRNPLKRAFSYLPTLRHNYSQGRLLPAARREERTASEPDLSEVFLLQFSRIPAFSLAVKYLVRFFLFGLRRSGCPPDPLASTYCVRQSASFVKPG